MMLQTPFTRPSFGRFTRLQTPFTRVMTPFTRPALTPPIPPEGLKPLEGGSALDRTPAERNRTDDVFRASSDGRGGSGQARTLTTYQRTMRDKSLILLALQRRYQDCVRYLSVSMQLATNP